MGGATTSGNGTATGGRAVKAVKPTNSAQTEEAVYRKYGQIVVPERLNARHDLPELQQLATSIATRGLLEPIVVTPIDESKPGHETYLLVDGGRRFAAYGLLGWKDRDIQVNIRRYKDDDVLGPVIDSWVANEERSEVDFLDKCERVHELSVGTYYVRDGHTPVAVDNAGIMKAFNIEHERSVQKMLGVWRNLDTDVGIAARKVSAPQWLVIALSQIKGEGETKAEKEEDRAAKQAEKLGIWIEQKKELEALGRSRSKRNDAGKKKKKKKKKKKAVADAPEWGAIDCDVVLDKKERNASDYYDLLVKKYEAGNLSKEASWQIDGAVQIMRFLSFDIKRLPFVVEADFAELMPAPANEGGDDEEVIEEEG